MNKRYFKYFQFRLGNQSISKIFNIFINLRAFEFLLRFRINGFSCKGCLFCFPVCLKVCLFGSCLFSWIRILLPLIPFTIFSACASGCFELTLIIKEPFAIPFRAVKAAFLFLTMIFIVPR